MKISTFPLGALQTNCFVVEKNEQAVIIDPGGDASILVNYFAKRNVEVQAILLTHAHFDHIGAVDEVSEYFKAPIYVHKHEVDWLRLPEKNGSGVFPGIPEIRIKREAIMIDGEQELTIGEFTFELYETPGHSPGSVSYYLPEENTIISGDVLFRGGVGRTDLFGGDHDTLMDSIHDKMLQLPDETIVKNGHGPDTTIGEEKETNPFINGFGW
ncbi:MBL fold metallo-hydrolase [Paenalkalicoccus suaedae]|uniref:MBL fold metallo-hydrolase n=1 Tax=Paenalkalicoccus suaedae TaxID=2592382 RepID=A0A859FEA5_9BACI|nr:MBL fold metallo-hydrolase [Paenalkalicoccus suaedae]QKS70924.1 MBL fold metallo-hydrolase [Paenalkalicoccus suaedae]